jgi:arylmalonate decarboxylase
MTRIGLIVPPLHAAPPPDAAAMYPQFAFEIAGIGVQSLTADGYAEAVGRVADAARSLAAREVASVLLFGTSLSFFKGAAFNAELESVIREAAGVPAMTLTSAMALALAELGARRIAVATAYTDPVDRMFRSYFEEAGFGIEAISGLGITSLAEVERLAPERIAQLARQVSASAPEAEAIVLSCAGMRTTPVAAALERELGKPVISSAMVGSWAAVRLAGASGACPGMGQLYEA